MQPNEPSECIPILAHTGMFSGFAPRDIADILPCLRPCHRRYGKGEMVLWEGDTVTEIGVVLAGQARSLKTDLSGKTAIVTQFGQCSYIGVLLAASRRRPSPVSVQALTPLSALFFPMARIILPCPRACEKHSRLLANILDGVAEKALVLHDRNDCLLRPTVREKVLTYLVKVARESERRAFTIPFDRSAMAEYLNVDRSALSRELSRMRADGLIDFHKNRFKLLS